MGIDKKKIYISRKIGGIFSMDNIVYMHSHVSTVWKKRRRVECNKKKNEGVFYFSGVTLT